MRGQVEQRGADSWRLKVVIGRSDDGKRRDVERTFRGTRAEAGVALARLVVEAADGRYVAAAGGQVEGDAVRRRRRRRTAAR